MTTIFAKVVKSNQQKTPKKPVNMRKVREIEWGSSPLASIQKS
nr:MAG TPA: hypothetical protein [Bacteriophage sp.]